VINFLIRTTNGPTIFPNPTWAFLSAPVNIDLGSILDQLGLRPLIEKVAPSLELASHQNSARLEPVKIAPTGMGMGGENGKKIGMGRVLLKWVWVWIWVCVWVWVYVLPAPYSFYQHSPRTALYKTHTRLFKILICCLYLDSLLAVLSCIVFKSLVRHFVRNYNYQVPIYCFDWQTFSCIQRVMTCC